MREPLISAIMPVFNSEKFLDASIGAVLGQTFSDWELILVNDGSTDGSLAVCKKFAEKDARITVIDKKNEGAGPTRNAGIKRAAGKYIMFPDSDDRLDVKAFEICINAMEKSDADLLVFGMATEIYDNDADKFIGENRDDIPCCEFKTKEECRQNWTKLYRAMDMGSPCNKVYRRSLIDTYGIEYPPLRRMQDGVFNMEYFDKISSFESINDVLFYRTWHKLSFTLRKIPKSFIECAIYHHQTLERLMTEWGVYGESDKLYFGERFSETVMTAEFDYLPESASGFFAVYRHIKSVNGNPYIHNFYKNYKKTKKRVRKKELAMLCGFNLLLAAQIYIKRHKR